MNKFSVIVLGIILLYSPCVSASLAKEEISVGPVDIRMPRWHQEISLDGISLSVDYFQSASEPRPFSSIKNIKVEADFGIGGNVDIIMNSSEACEEAWGASDNESIVEGVRCLRWDNSSYVVVEFKAKFEESLLADGIEYLAMTSVEIKGSPLETVFLRNPFGPNQP